MKFLRHASALAVAAIVSGSAANAYTLEQAAKPREVPPASYTRDAYVDSRGCAYSRANIGNTVNWVPRLTANRKEVVCGLTPTATALRTAAAAGPVTLPSAPVATTTAPAATPVAARAPGVTTTTTTATTGAMRTLNVTCPTDGSAARVRVGKTTLRVSCRPGQTQPASYIVQHANGDRTRLIATPAAAGPVVTVTRVPDGPIPASGAPTSSARVRIGGVPIGGATNGFGNGYGLGSGTPVAGALPRATTTTTVVVHPTTTGPSAPAVTTTFGNGYGLPVQPDAGRVYIPSGYRPAWDDDRLNPQRGPRTASGNAQMAASWTDDVPMRATTTTGGGVVLSTKSPTATTTTPAATTGRYVQVGAFGQAANATAASQRLAGLGLPGRVGKTASGLSVVMAGPFASAAEAQAALAKARRGGFPDAFLRG